MQLTDYLKANLEHLAHKTELKDKRSVLLCNKNKTLFNLLGKIGLWKFYENNTGKVIGYSQVVAFLFCGGLEALANGFTAVNLEVHHISGDVTDNSADNLVYLSREDHEYVSHVSYTQFHGRLEEHGSTPFNKRGRPVSNAIHFLVNIVQQTVTAVAKKRTNIDLKLRYEQILGDIPKNLWKSCYQKNLPRWMKRYILLALRPDLTPETSWN